MIVSLTLSKMIKQRPILAEYQDAWPVDDALRMRLKYSSSQARKKNQEVAAAAQVVQADTAPVVDSNPPKAAKKSVRVSTRNLRSSKRE